MRRYIIALVSVLLFSGMAFADSNTANSLTSVNPASGTYGDVNYPGQIYNSLANEAANRAAEVPYANFVSTIAAQGAGTANPSACLGTTGAGLTMMPGVCLAYNAGYRGTETGSITFSNNTTTWVAMDENTSGGNAGLPHFTRVGATHYLTDAIDATRPAMVFDSQLLMKVATSGGSITAVTDLRNLSPIENISVGASINLQSFSGADLAAKIQAAIASGACAGASPVSPCLMDDGLLATASGGIHQTLNSVGGAGGGISFSVPIRLVIHAPIDFTGVMPTLGLFQAQTGADGFSIVGNLGLVRGTGSGGAPATWNSYFNVAPTSGSGPVFSMAGIMNGAQFYNFGITTNGNVSDIFQCGGLNCSHIKIDGVDYVKSTGAGNTGWFFQTVNNGGAGECNDIQINNVHSFGGAHFVGWNGCNSVGGSITNSEDDNFTSGPQVQSIYGDNIFLGTDNFQTGSLTANTCTIKYNEPNGYLTVQNVHFENTNVANAAGTCDLYMNGAVLFASGNSFNGGTLGIANDPAIGIKTTNSLQGGEITSNQIANYATGGILTSANFNKLNYHNNVFLQGNALDSVQFVDTLAAPGDYGYDFPGVWQTSDLGPLNYNIADGINLLGSLAITSVGTYSTAPTVTPVSAGIGTTWYASCQAYDSTKTAVQNSGVQSSTNGAVLSSSSYNRIVCAPIYGAAYYAAYEDTTNPPAANKCLGTTFSGVIDDIGQGRTTCAQSASDKTGGLSINAQAVIDKNTNGTFASITLKGGGILDSTGGAAPTITAGCTAGGGSGVVGTNVHGTITTGGSAATTCTMTFSAAGVWPAAPDCVFTDANASTTPVAYSTGAISTSTVVIDFASAASRTIKYVCIGG